MGNLDSCTKPECIEQVMVHALTFSDINQAKVRMLNPEDQFHCERCDAIARYHFAPIEFK